jgi:hypothetical protein
VTIRRLKAAPLRVPEGAICFVSRVLWLAVPAGIIVTLATFCTYLSAQGGFGEATPPQASTAALITLIVAMLHVLSIVCRPYEGWKLLLLAGSALGYALIFTWSLTQSLFVLDLSNGRALGIGLGLGLDGSLFAEAATACPLSPNCDGRTILSGPRAGFSDRSAFSFIASLRSQAGSIDL